MKTVKVLEHFWIDEVFYGDEELEVWHEREDGSLFIYCPEKQIGAWVAKELLSEE